MIPATKFKGIYMYKTNGIINTVRDCLLWNLWLPIQGQDKDMLTHVHVKLDII